MWYIEHDPRMIASLDLFVEVAGKMFCNDEGNLSGLTKLD